MIDFLLQILALHAIELRDARKRITELEQEKEKYYKRYLHYADKYHTELVSNVAKTNEKLKLYSINPKQTDLIDIDNILNKRK